jgi:osmotically-inducible protein OsmY
LRRPSARSKEIQVSKSNDEIQRDVRCALQDDPRIPFDDEIAVEAYDGLVTLRGTVGSFGQDRAAVADARGTSGVYDVYDQLQVRLLNDDRRADAEIRGAALQRLMWDPMLDADYLDVRVKDGWVTLTGDADRQFQSDKAFDHMTSLRGVTGVTNEIRVTEPL